MVAVRKKKKHVSKNKRTKILKAVASGQTVKSVAQANGVHVNQIYYWMKKKNVPHARARRKQVDQLNVHSITSNAGLAKLPEDIKKIVLEALSTKYGVDLT